MANGWTDNIYLSSLFSWWGNPKPIPHVTPKSESPKPEAQLHDPKPPLPDPEVLMQQLENLNQSLNHIEKERIMSANQPTSTQQPTPPRHPSAGRTALVQTTTAATAPGSNQAEAVINLIAQLLPLGLQIALEIADVFGSTPHTSVTIPPTQSN